jgi:hypothetical protein
MKDCSQRIHSACALTLLSALVVSASALVQLTVPNVEARQDALFEDFAQLERLGAYVVGEDGEMLGKISRNLGQDSLGNEYGAGSEYRSNGIFNPYSKYGSPYSPTSAFNKHATKPPKILVQRDGNVYSVGLLTTNRTAPTNGQRINPYLLQAWLKSK